MTESNFNINGYNLKDYEFIDFGCSNGGSLELYKKTFKVKGKGLGIDIDERKVNNAREAGHDAICMDITKLNLNSIFKFCTMHHFLEHIPSVVDIKNILQQACKISSEFVYIRQPYFDADPYLFQNGFKLYWSDWRGHPNHMTTLELHNIISPFLLSGLINNFSIYYEHEIIDSRHHAIHNIDSSVDQHQWNKDKHSKKNIMQFAYPIFTETIAIIDINGKNIKQIEKKFPNMKRIFSSKNVSPQKKSKGMMSWVEKYMKKTSS